MKIRSERQFETYVISWFLLVVGAIFIIGSLVVFKNFDDFLRDKILASRQAQVEMAAHFIDPERHYALTGYQLPSNFAKSLEQALGRVMAQESSADIHWYSLNWQAESNQLFYAVDPKRAEQDRLELAIAEHRFFLLRLENGELAISSEHRLQKKISIALENKIIEFQLDEQNNPQQLLLNDQVVLRFESRQGVEAKVAGKLLSQAPRQQIQFDLEGNGLPVAIKVSLLKQGQPLNPQNQLFNTSPDLASEIVSMLKRDQKFGQWASPDNGVYLFAAIGAQKTAKASGCLVLHIGEEGLYDLSMDIVRATFFSFVALLVLLMMAAIFFTRKIIKPIAELDHAISRLIHNDFNFKLSAKGFGSLGFLAQKFNLMLTRLQKSRNEMIQLNKSYSRFVPHQLLKQLSSSGVKNISLGDCCEQKMTVMFCDIRGFTSISESLSPEANFRFINRYMGHIAPVINRHGGIIDKYMGDGVMAVFPNSADEALSAAIEVLISLEKYNSRLLQKKLPAIEIGLGLQTGNVMIGTVGAQSRMDATVISDAVNAAARVESLTKVFGTRILITEEVKKELSDLSRYKMRYIATWKVLGKARPITLYEIFDNDPVSIQREKAYNQKMMIKAWNTYLDGDSAMAIQLYQKLIEKSPHDQSLLALVEHCQKNRPPI